MAELAWRLGLTPEDLEHTIVQPTSLLPSLYNRSDISEMNREQMIRQVQLLDVDAIKLPRGTAVPYIPATMHGQPLGYMVPAWSLRAMHQNIYPVQQIRNQVSLGAPPTLLLSTVAELRLYRTTDSHGSCCSPQEVCVQAGSAIYRGAEGPPVRVSCEGSHDRSRPRPRAGAVAKDAGRLYIRKQSGALAARQEQDPGIRCVAAHSSALLCWSAGCM